MLSAVVKNGFSLWPVVNTRSGQNGTNLRWIWEDSCGLKFSSYGVVLSADDSSLVCAFWRGVLSFRAMGNEVVRDNFEYFI